MGKLLFEQKSYHKKIDYELTKPEQGAVVTELFDNLFEACGLPIMVMVDGEVVEDGSATQWLGQMKRTFIDEVIVLPDGRIFRWSELSRDNGDNPEMEELRETDLWKEVILENELGAAVDPLRIAGDFLTWLDVLIIEVGAPTY